MCFTKIINWKNSYLFNVDILLSYPASVKDSKISILNKNMRFFIKCVYIFIKFLHPLSVAEVRFLKELIVFGKERIFMFSREKFFVVKFCTNSCSWEKYFIKLDGKLLSCSKYILIWFYCCCYCYCDYLWLLMLLLILLLSLLLFVMNKSHI